MLFGIVLSNLNIIGALVMYVIIFFCFIALRTKLSYIPRAYHSRFHIAGAVYGLIIFTACFICVCMYQPWLIVTTYALMIWYGGGCCYYVLVGRKRYSDLERSSPEEKFAFFANIDATKLLNTGIFIKLLVVC
jgi:amino acid transporter